MSLEILPNELLLSIFERLGSVDIICAFYNLNYRFNGLIICYFKNHTLEFASVPKILFDSFCCSYLPSIVDQISSIHLSDSYVTRHQTDRFFFHGFTFSRLVHLRKLTMHYVRFEEKTYQMMEEAHHLTYLSLFKCDPGHDDATTNRFLNSIWKLPKLEHCCLNLLVSDIHFSEPQTIVSSSLQYLYFCNYASTLSYSELTYLTKSTPNLQYFGGYFDDIDNDKQSLASLPSLATLNILFCIFRPNAHMTLGKMFQSMPNLCHLTLELEKIIDGHCWEQMIIKNVPNLKVFRFAMYYTRFKLFEFDTEQTINQLVNSFRTRFWLEQHQWFIRCDWNFQNVCKDLMIYTLPYAFPGTRLGGITTGTLNTGNYDAHSSYNSVRTYNYSRDMNTDLSLSDVCFLNIRKLCIELPFRNNLWTLFPRFDHLLSMNVRLSDSNDSQSQLQTLLDRAPSLYSLGIDGLPSVVLPLIENIYSQSIQQLHLPPVPINMLYYPRYILDKKYCDQLSHSSLAMQCHVLRVEIDDASSILDLINTMNNLRVLSVLVCNKDNLKDEPPPAANDKLVRWLEQHLPSSCEIKRDRWCPHDIQLWLR